MIYNSDEFFFGNGLKSIAKRSDKSKKPEQMKTDLVQDKFKLDSFLEA